MVVRVFEGSVVSDIERELLERCDPEALGRISLCCVRLRDEAAKVARAVYPCAARRPAD
jgi:hypothetical protein